MDFDRVLLDIGSRPDKIKTTEKKKTVCILDIKLGYWLLANKI